MHRPALRRPRCPFRPGLHLRPLTRALAAAGLLAAPLWLQAQVLPQGLAVVQGQASVAAQGAQMTVKNSPGAILNWSSFNIGAGAAVRFDQVNAASKVLNRVTGSDPSAIFGSLTSNGQVWLLNPNGVLFGASARVDVAGLVASTLRLNDNDFLAGRYRFNALEGDRAGVRNEGALKSSFGGQIVLLGHVVTNTGSVEAPGGSVTVAASRSVELVDTGLPNLAVRVEVPTGDVLNLGQLAAPGGEVDVWGGIVNQRGLISADTVGRDDRGRVTLHAADTLMLGEASRTTTLGVASGAKGGQIDLLAPQAGAVGHAVVDASGAAGGGSIRLGGGFQGKEADVPNSRAVFVGSDVTLRADATAQGDGGRVIVWADTGTRFAGLVSARGAGTGAGGFAEVSGKGTLEFTGRADLTSPGGAQGTLLLDPLNLTIQETGPAINGSSGDLGSPNLLFGDFAGVNSIITRAAVNSQLASADVTLQATNDITILNGATQLSGPNRLTLQAGGNINVAGSITAAGGITLSANDSFGTPTGSGAVTLTGFLNAGTGRLEIRNFGSSGIHSLGGDLTGRVIEIGGKVTIGTAARTWTTDGFISSGEVISGTGSIVKAGPGLLQLSGTNTYSGGTTVSAGTLALTNATATAGAGPIALGANTLELNVSVSNALTVTSGATIIGGTLAAGPAITLGNAAVLNLSNVSVLRTITDAAGDGVVAITGGTVALQGANSYGGGTTLAAGTTLRVSGVNATAGTGSIAIGANTLDIAGGATLANSATVNGGRITNSSGSGTLSGSTAMAADTTLSSAGTGLTVSGVLSGAGGLSIVGAGTVTLAGVNTYSGDTNVFSGTLRLGAANVIPSGAGPGRLRVLFGSTLDLNGNSATVDRLGGGGTIDSFAGGALTLTVGGTNDDSSFSGELRNTAGTLALTKIGTGTLTLSGSNTYAGATNVNAGTLVASSASALGTTAAGTTVASGATLQISGVNIGTEPLSLAGAGVGGTTGALVGAGAAASGGTVTLTADTAIAVNGTNSLNLSGAIGGPFGLSKVGAGTLTLGSANVYTGSTAIAAGTVVAPAIVVNAGASSLGNSSSAVVLGDATQQGTLSYSGGAETFIRGFTVNAGGGRISNSGGNPLSVAAAGIASAGTLTVDAAAGSDISISSVISGSGGLSKTGAGTVMLGAANTYTGTTTVSAGTLALGGSNVLADASSLVVAGGTFDINSHSDTVASLSLQGGGVTGTTGVLTSTADVDARSGSIGAVLGGSAGLNKTTAGTVTLATASTYTGTTTVADGTLSLNGNAALPSLLLTGGQVDGTGSLTVGGNFLRSGGSVGSGFSAIDITQASGDLRPGALSAGTVRLTTQDAAGRLEVDDIVSSSGAMDIRAAGSVDVLAASSAAALIAGGNQSITAASLQVQGGDTGAGRSAEVAAAGNQSITVTGSGGLSVLGGGGTSNFARIVTQGAAQTLTGNGGALVLEGGAGGIGNFAAVGTQAAAAPTQVVSGFSSLRISGGASGSSNYAGLSSGAGSQSLSVGALSLQGGLGGNNNYAVAEAPGASQTVNVGADATLTAGAGGVGNAATLVAQGQTINVAGNLALAAGASSVNGLFGTVDAGARIGGPDAGYMPAPGNLALTVGGNLVMTGGSNGSGAVLGFPVGVGQAATIAVTAGGDIRLNPGTQPGSGTRIGSEVGGTLAGGDITLAAPNGTVFLNGSFNGGVAAEVTVLTAGNVAFSARNLDIGSAVSGQTLQAVASNGLRLRDAAVLTASASSGDALTLRAGAGGLDNAAGAGVLGVAGSARWLAYAPDPSLFTGGGLVPAFKQYAAPFGTTPAASGNGLLLALAPTLTAALQGAVSKVYDATTTATLVPANFVLSGAQASDTAALGSTTNGAYSSKDVGSGKTVLATGLAAAVTDTATGVPVYGYAFSGTASGAVGSITPATLSLSGLTVPSRVYDATRVATLGGTPAVAALAGDAVSVAGVASGLFGDKNVGTAKPVTVSGLALAGADAGNYVLLSPGLQGDITPRALSVAGLSAADKVYDATRTATLLGTATVVPVSGDVLSLAGTPTALFADKNVGTAKSVTVGGYALIGTDAANYQLQQPSALVASITPATLSLAGLAAQDKTYDGSNAVTMTATLAGVRPGDAVSLALGGSFATAGAGNAKPVAYSASTGGGDAGNYSLAGASGSTSATILPATLTYRADTLSQNVGLPIPALTGTVTGFVGAETLASATTGALRFTTAANASTTAGTYAVTGSGLLAGNYEFVQAPGNAQALRLTGLFTAYPSLVPPTNTLAQTLQTVQVPLAMSSPTVGRVLDVTPGTANYVASELAPAGLSGGFGAVSFSTMSRADVQSLLTARDQYKKQTLAAGITKLELDPGLANVPECADEAEITSGRCLVTQALREKIQRRLASLTAEGRAGAQQGAPDHRRIMQAALPGIARKLAVLIGINRYVDSRIPTLSGSIPDARAIRQLLESRLGYEATLVEDGSREAIVRALNKVALEAGSNDSVIVYYAGHGVVVPVGGVNTGFWLPADGNAEDPGTWLSNADIGRLVSAIGSKQLMLVSDSCFSGALAGSERVQVDRSAAAAELLSRRAAVVLSSGGNEPVADEGREGHSVFAWHFMRALEGLNDWQVGSTLFERVRDAVVKDFPQTPQYGASRSAGHQGNTDYLFERRELEAQTAPR